MSTVSRAAAEVPAGGRPIRLKRMGDELLARYAARGSKRAFAALYERYHQPLYRYCRSIVRNEADAQDALQSTFASALAALRRDARNAPLRPWLYRIAHNESVSVVRRRKRDARNEMALESTAPGFSAEDQAAGRARWQRLVTDLAELPERQRGALLLRELAGLSHEEIALALGLTLGTAKQAIFEARQGLAEAEEGRAMSCDDVRRRVSEGDGRVLRGRRVRAHLRDCAACEAFASAIPARRSELRALAPALPAATAAGMLGRLIGGGSSHGAGAATAGSAAGAGAVGKTAGTVIAFKTLAGAALVVTATAGLTHVLHPARPAPRPRSETRLGTTAPTTRAPARAASSHASAAPLGAASGGGDANAARTAIAHPIRRHAGRSAVGWAGSGRRIAAGHGRHGSFGIAHAGQRWGQRRGANSQSTRVGGSRQAGHRAAGQGRAHTSATRNNGNQSRSATVVHGRFGHQSASGVKRVSQNLRGSGALTHLEKGASRALGGQAEHNPA